MRSIVIIAFLTLTSTFVHSQGRNVILGSTNYDKYYLAGSIPYNSTGNHEKLKVIVFGGNWHSNNLGETVYYISSRDNLLVNIEKHGGSSSRFELRIFDNGTSYDVTIHTNAGYPAIQIRSWYLNGTGDYVDFEIIDYAINGNNDITSQATFTNIFISDNLGNVGIGTPTPDYKLDVLGTIRANEVKVATGWSDFVFKPDYDLPTLQEVENYIDKNGHLPDIPSAEEVKADGISLGEMDAKLLQKIEELMLYVIELQKELNDLSRENEGLIERIRKLETDN